ncbi:MAG: trimeric intracellular cation channel family protein [Ruminococcaceae bacterium]|nr:trimeric intracellular cation channel family protein [Oscillospiraceae bacterium]
MDVFVTILEMIGIVSFAASGALTAMKKHMDLFGVIVLGLVPSIGGGIVRDLILGNTPPLAFSNPAYTIVAVTTSIIIFIPWVRHHLMHKERLFEYSLFFMDSLGLGVFTVMGIWNALEFLPESGSFLLVFVGVMTGVGGGMIRDVLAGDMPYILVKHIYACASIVGAVCCVLLRKIIPLYLAMLIGCILVLTVRLLAAHYHWNLPKADDIE